MFSWYWGFEGCLLALVTVLLSTQLYLFRCLLAGLSAASAICNSKMVSFACSEVAQVSRASGAVFAFSMTVVLPVEVIAISF